MRGSLVDVHAHFLPDAYRSAAVAAGHGQPDGFPQLPGWTAAEHVASMEAPHPAPSSPPSPPTPTTSSPTSPTPDLLPGPREEDALEGFGRRELGHHL
jgi:hypothetical protein